jgi:hypothetical protein
MASYPKAALLRPVSQWGWLVAVAGGVLIAAFAAAKGQPKTQPVVGDDAPVLAADSALGEAMRTGDKAAARRILSLQFSFVDADGKVHARKDVLADLKGLAAGPASDAGVRSFGLLAMVTGRRKSAGSGDVFFLDVWAKQKGAWRVLLIQNVPIAAADTPAVVAAAPASDPQHYECMNPCQTLPYRVRSAAEQDVINAFQAVMKAIVGHDANEWGKHVADEFMIYGSDRAPIPKPGRIAAIERQKERNAAVTVSEVQTMRLAVYGDGALMITAEAAADNSRPPYRAARVWVRRGGQWLMAISAHTEVK